MGFDNVYQAITEPERPDQHWAFGTGFSDPFSGIATGPPEGVDPMSLFEYCLMLADDSLIASHRLQQWITHLPELEQETAVANIALDLLGQSRILYGRAAALEAKGRTEDDYAFSREAKEFLNVTFVEDADDDFASLTLRLAVFGTWRLSLFRRLAKSRDPLLSALGAKAAKELSYHKDWAADWVVTLGDGTEYSREKVIEAMDHVALELQELFVSTELEREMERAGFGVDPSTIRPEVEAFLVEMATQAGLAWPSPGPGALLADASRLMTSKLSPTGRVGIHTEALPLILSELQSLARAHPGAKW
jgi:ring-1,2-phenylacetyl-CoA epoxidase subunit PaaC